jgi:hypothetical protein
MSQANPPPALRGHVDGVFVAERFVEVRGWVCALDRTPAEPPLTLALNGRQFAGYGLTMRRDLAEAGIAGGIAFFDAVLPIDDATPDQAHQLTITDAVGRGCTLPAAPARVATFTPLGAIDAAGARLISGWVFDPYHEGGGAHPCLYFDGDFVCRLNPAIDRQDLSYDLGDGLKSFGYEILGEILVPPLIRLHRRDPARVGTLVLASSGMALASAPLSLHDGAPVMAPSAPCRPPIRLPVSDHLAALLWDGS